MLATASSQATAVPQTPSPVAVQGITTRHVEGVLVLSPQGGLDAASAGALDRLLSEATVPVVVDLNDCIVVDPHLLRGEQQRLFDGARELCVTCRRLSARRLLARTAALDDVVVFQSVQDALQARAMQRAGYGSGWRLRHSGERGSGPHAGAVTQIG